MQFYNHLQWLLRERQVLFNLQSPQPPLPQVAHKTQGIGLAHMLPCIHSLSFIISKNHSNISSILNSWSTSASHFCLYHPALGANTRAKWVLFYLMASHFRPLMKENIDGKYIGFKTAPIVVILVKYIYWQRLHWIP